MKPAFTAPLLVLAILLTASTLSAAAAPSEYVFLKNGQILKGKILEETTAVITIKIKNGPVQTIKRSDTIRIMYTEIYLGKVTVNKTDGTVFEGYMVYEDRLDYIFRYDIDKPAEFTVPRADVLSISRSNPTNLAGRPGETRIELQWKAPLTQPEKYNVYMKTRENEKYRLIGSTRSTLYSVKSLKKKTQFYFIVKGVDFDEVESLPSNEIKVTTNIPPDAPGGVSRSEFKDKDGKLKLKLTWDEAEDPDGTVTEYSVYAIVKKRYINLGKTKKREYVVENYDPDQKADYYAASIDDNGDECDRPVMDYRTFGFQALAGWAFPVEKSGELLEPDLHMGLMAEYRFYSFWELDFYAVAAYSYFSHAGSFQSTELDVVKMNGG